jgi:hypothetical protein
VPKHHKQNAFFRDVLPIALTQKESPAFSISSALSFKGLPSFQLKYYILGCLRLLTISPTVKLNHNKVHQRKNLGPLLLLENVEKKEAECHRQSFPSI